MVDFEMLAIQVMPVKNNMLQHRTQMLEQWWQPLPAMTTLSKD
jgi:hypothetical protein